MNGRDQVGGERRRPTTALVKNMMDLSDDYDLLTADKGGESASVSGPMFGPFLRDRRCAQAAGAAAEMLGTVEGTTLQTMTKTVPVPDGKGCGGGANENDNADCCATKTLVERAVGSSLKSVGAYKSLDRRAQVIALINEVGIVTLV